MTLPIGQTLDDAIAKYDIRITRHGEKWKTIPIEELRGYLRDEIQEWETETNTPIINQREYGELLDVINMCFMVAARYGGPK